MADNVTKADLKAARLQIKAFLAALLGSGFNVHARRRMIVNRAAFANKYGVTVDGQTVKQIRFVEIEFLRWSDSPDEGFEDCPVMAGIFNLHCFVEFLDLGEDDAAEHSEDVFEGLLMDLRDGYLETQDWTVGPWAVSSLPLVQRENAGFGNDVFSDATGHFTDLELTLGFYDE